MEQTTIMHNKLIRRTIKFYCQRIAPIRQQKGAIFFRHHAKMCLVRRRLPANGCAHARFHSPADKIYESECVSVRVSIQPEKAPEPSQPTSQPASGLLLCQVPLRCNYDKVKWLVFITRPALIHNECDMMAAGIPRIPRRWKIAHSPDCHLCRHHLNLICAKRRSLSSSLHIAPRFQDQKTGVHRNKQIVPIPSTSIY